MSQRAELDRLKPQLKILAASFAGAFAGTVWVAYLALYMNVSSPGWLLLSAVGGFVGGVVMPALFQRIIDVRRLLKDRV